MFAATHAATGDVSSQRERTAMFWSDGLVNGRRGPVALATLSLHLCSEWTHRILPRRRRRRRFRDNLISRDVVGSAAERPALTSPSSPAARSIDNDPTSCPQFIPTVARTDVQQSPTELQVGCLRAESITKKRNFFKMKTNISKSYMQNVLKIK